MRRIPLPKPPLDLGWTEDGRLHTCDPAMVWDPQTGEGTTLARQAYAVFGLADGTVGLVTRSGVSLAGSRGAVPAGPQKWRAIPSGERLWLCGDRGEVRVLGLPGLDTLAVWTLEGRNRLVDLFPEPDGTAWLRDDTGTWWSLSIGSDPRRMDVPIVGVAHARVERHTVTLQDPG